MKQWRRLEKVKRQRQRHENYTNSIDNKLWVLKNHLIVELRYELKDVLREIFSRMGSF